MKSISKVLIVLFALSLIACSTGMENDERVIKPTIEKSNVAPPATQSTTGSGNDGGGDGTNVPDDGN